MPHLVRRSFRRAAELALQPLEPRLMMARVQGVDVSKWQGVMNWTTNYNAGNRFAFAKASQGTTVVDEQFVNNRTNAKPAGLLIGFYHYSEPSSALDANADGLNDDAVAEADHFYATAGNWMTTGYLRPMVDVESNPGGLTDPQLADWVNDFCSRIQQLTGGVDPIIYCNTNYATNFLTAANTIHDLWIANYNSTIYGDPNTSGSPPTGFWGAGNWDFWQYSADGNGLGPANGTTGSSAIDIDVFKGASNGADPTNDLQLLKQNFVIGAPGIPSGPSPANIASNVSPLNVVFDWNDSPGATRYDIYLDNMITPFASNLTTSQYSAGHIAGGAHTWKVVAKGGSSDDDTFVSGPVWSFTANPLPLPGVPGSPSPHNVYVINKPVILDWADLPTASAYDVYLGANVDPTYANLTVSQSPPINPTDGQRLWRVVAKNATGSTNGPQWSYIMDATRPLAVYGNQTPTGGAATFDFTVTYNDLASGTGVDFTSLDSSDVSVWLPNGGGTINATLIDIDADANGPTRIATYRISAPGGTWDVTDNGAYVVRQNADQVRDLAGGYRAAGEIGTFTVNLFAYQVGATLHVDFDGTTMPIALLPTAGAGAGGYSASRNGTTLNFTGVATINVAGTSADDHLRIGGALPVPLSFDNGAGNDSVTVTGGGTYTFANELNATLRNIDVTVDAGATALFDTTFHVDRLTVTGHAMMLTDGGRALVVKDLLIGAAGRLDLSDNDMVIDYEPGATPSPIGAFDGTAYTGIRGELQRASDFGSWDQPGIFTSQLNAGSAVGMTTLAVGEAADAFFLGGTDTAAFNGVTVDASAVVIKYTYAGDVNFDGLVDGGDYGTLDKWIQFPGTSGFMNGDVNYDGIIDGADYGTLDNAIQLQGDPL